MYWENHSDDREKAPIISIKITEKCIIASKGQLHRKVCFCLVVVV